MTDSIPQRRCKQCENEYPPTPDYFPHGRGNFCIPCQRAKERAYRAQHREDRRAQSKAFYERNTEKVKAKSNEYRLTHPEEVKIRKHDYYERNRDEIQAKQNARRLAHPEKTKAQKRAHYLRHRDHILQRSHSYRMNHLEADRERHRAWKRTHWEEHRKQRKQYAEANRAMIRSKDREYHRTHPEQHLAAFHRRRARKRQAGGSYTIAQIRETLVRQKQKCYYCSIKFQKEKGKYIYHVDHVIPLARGGTNDISNIVLACPTCNFSKKDKLPHEWFEGGRLL